MEASIVVLPKPTNRTASGPKIHKDVDGLMIEYDYEHDDGSIEWSRVVFKEVLAFEYRDFSCCKAENVISAEQIRFVSHSEWLTEVITFWQESVGWQEWQKNQGGANRFKHYTIYFDDEASVDVIAAYCTEE